MTIGTNDLIDKFGTQDAVTTAGAEAAADAFISAGEWTNDDDAPEAGFVLVASWATETNIAGLLVNLYTRLKNIQSTNDAGAVMADNSAIFLGSFLVPAEDASDPYYMPLLSGLARLPNYYTSAVHEFYIENKTGQTIAANWSLYVTPITQGPHA